MKDLLTTEDLIRGSINVVEVFEREHHRLRINVKSFNVGNVYYATIDPQQGDIIKIVVIGYKARVTDYEYDEITGDMPFVHETIFCR